MTSTPKAFWRGQPLDAILFDLDGTLLDTASDIARALNRMLSEHGYAPLAVPDVARMVGRGAGALVERAVAARDPDVDDAGRAAMTERFFHHYAAIEQCGESTAQPYAGAHEALRRLHGAHLRIAVVTNKKHQFADALLNRLGLMQWVDVLVGGDTCERRKPDPMPLLFACESLAVAPSRALMVGDSINDVDAARAARMRVVCVPYGYNEGRDPRTLACDAMIESLADLPALILPATVRPS